MRRSLRSSMLQVRLQSLGSRRSLCTALVAAVLGSGVLTHAQAPASRQQPPATPVATPTPTPASAPALQLLGYGDLNLHLLGIGRQPDANFFRLGEFDLMFLSNLSESWRVLGETVIKAESSNEFEVEVERLILTYAPRDYFELGLGRYNTSFGYYSTTYSHPTYFQTAATRPLLFEFEDNGGLLPEHNTGVTVSGRLPGPLRPRYFVEVGNGQLLRSSAEGSSVESGAHGSGSESLPPGQTVSDENRWKAVNLGMQIRPVGIPGFQFGGNAYFDTLGPDPATEVKERIVAAYVAYQDENWELLAEGASIRTQARGAARFRSEGFYAQVARQLGAVRPFARYQEVFVPLNEPGLSYQPGRTSGPSVGVRLDPAPYVALKFQVDRFRHSDRPNETSFVAQASFGF